MCECVGVCAVFNIKIRNTKGPLIIKIQSQNHSKSISKRYATHSSGTGGGYCIKHLYTWPSY